ncbi:toll/interleukin-1 receptor domain-containing protein [uncultured Ruegeria sp.]|uniref:toll/interleukin-1 receptor domain-containing protein n=1 Tax=uncultured Ruegeria sp. TaxID=259304 RepID=UPI00260993B4|nr:toll/interleukin-1 receptor domain-containing protein [uncultured Ruegeria sp.]
MADICLIYSSTDFSLVEELVKILRQRWTVWWDDDATGRFQEVIPSEIKKAACVLPIWSAAARSSNRVYSELEIAEKAGAVLIPARIEECEAPDYHAEWSTVDLIGWDGEADHPGLRQLQRKISKVVAPKSPPERTTLLADNLLRLPVLFHSTSTYETRLDPFEAVELLTLFGTGATAPKDETRCQTVLVSAYDLVDRNYPRGKDKKELRKLRNRIREFSKRGGFVMVDSGNYEAVRLDDKTWCRSDFSEALSSIPHNWVLSFDYSEPTSHEPPQRSMYSSAAKIIEQSKLDQKLTSAPIIPIVHSPKAKSGYGHDLQDLPKVVKQIAEELQPPMIAVPERELGPGIFECATTLGSIRKELQTLPFYQPIHVLGTGNPVSIVIYTAAGADSFDGLEWCRYVVDAKARTLHHTQHFDFFEYQALMADSKITQDAIRSTGDEDIGISGKVGLHNLDFYANFLNGLRIHTDDGKLEVFAERVLGEEKVSQSKTKIPGLFR